MTLMGEIKALYWARMDQYDKDSLHDIVFDAFDGIVVNEHRLWSVFFKIPNDDILDALKYGFSDTEVRESVYTYMKANPQLFLEDLK